MLAALARFCVGDMPSDSVFLLGGYAGTGKTSLMGALVKALREINMPAVLMAPTGRAAKVFGKFAGSFASTIHRRIYRPPPQARAMDLCRWPTIICATRYLSSTRLR